MYYRPIRLQKIREQVEHTHPYTAKDFNDPEKFKTSQIGKKLRERLRNSDDRMLPKLVASLRKYERKFLSTLAGDEEAMIRRQAIRCLYIEPDLAHPQHLWRSCANYFDDETTDWAFRLLHNHEPLNSQLQPGQTYIVEAFAQGRDTSLEKTWEFGANIGLDATDLRAHLRINEGGAFAKALDLYLMTRGNRRAWDTQSPTYLHAIYRGAEKDTQALILKNASQIYPEWQRHPDQRIITLAQEFASQDQLLDSIKQNDPPTWQWCRLLLRYLALEEFFGRIQDNERFEFWLKYIPRLVDLTQDVTNQRLFLDFGTFGVIEFGEVGNAAYIYLEKNFQYYLNKQKQHLHRVPDNNRLKDEDRAHSRLIHQRGWQRRFRPRLAKLFEYHNE